MCDPCRRVGPDPRRELPPGFYFQQPIIAALAEYDFGVVFRRVRAVTGWSQQTLAGVVGLDQPRISAIERGVSGLRDVALVAQVANADFRAVGSGQGPTRGRGVGAAWMDRGEALLDGHLASAALDESFGPAS